MNDQYLLAAIIGPLLLVMGLSLTIYSKVWDDMMKKWAKDYVTLFPLMALSLIFGLIVITKHNDWRLDPYLMITLFGWGAFLKGVFYFLTPVKTFKGLATWANKPVFRTLGGLVAILTGAWLSYLVYF